jgi:hypothetical protein
MIGQGRCGASFTISRWLLVVHKQGRHLVSKVTIKVETRRRIEAATE